MARLGAFYLAFNTFLYAAWGIAAFPAQEWLLELLVSIVFLFPALSAVRFGLTPGVTRAIGLALLFHSAWDLLHWPAIGIVATPIAPWIPRLDPIADILIGTAILVRASR
ncbi:MAG: hypothetical protein NDJ89_05300 [Oligoflexia bacterium]|nr:hypothetical protein [Oligoflexia bacterium]